MIRRRWRLEVALPEKLTVKLFGQSRSKHRLASHRHLGTRDTRSTTTMTTTTVNTGPVVTPSMAAAGILYNVLYTTVPLYLISSRFLDYPRPDLRLGAGAGAGSGSGWSFPPTPARTHFRSSSSDWKRASSVWKRSDPTLSCFVN